jgi:hypothetical protein
MIAPSQLPHLIHDIGTPRPQAAARARLPRRRALNADAAVSIRLAGDRDRTTLRDLEELDGRPLPSGRRLLAELGGVPVAAIAVADDTVVADPFARTTAVVDLLRVRARQLRGVTA